MEPRRSTIALIKIFGRVVWCARISKVNTEGKMVTKIVKREEGNMNPVDTLNTLDLANNKIDILNALNIAKDYGKPVYVEAHGGKNHVIMYRSRTNPELAIEFFFRSSSKDGRSRYYRCTKCWYKYKLNRGTCATLIVRDGRIITDPENPVVPHQCEFRSLETVKANRAWIASRKRTAKTSSLDDLYTSDISIPSTSGLNLREVLEIWSQYSNTEMSNAESTDEKVESGGETGGTSTPSSTSSKNGRNLDDNPVWARIRERITGVDNIDLACEESMGLSSPSGSPSPSYKFSNMDEDTAGSSARQFSVETNTDMAEDTEQNSYLDDAFTTSMLKKNDEALGKLQQAIDNNENFDIDDVSLVDNVFSYKFNNTTDVQDKIAICEEWLCFLAKITPIATSRWLSHYQFSIYYTFHMLSLVFRHYENRDEKKRFYKISLPLFKSLLQATNLIPETSEEIVNTKLDVLLSISFIAVQFYDVSDQEIVKYIEREMRSVGDSVAGNYSSEAATLMVQKVFRISNNLEERKRLLSGKVEYT
uniref:Bm10382 n=2 Tax=Brugia malayi TaxID=6279 RepID=A0A0H5S941_BRUMA|nr:Bm10382 [Brugia malayi]